jgi:hypothetical protein
MFLPINRGKASSAIAPRKRVAVDVSDKTKAVEAETKITGKIIMLSVRLYAKIVAEGTKHGFG